MRINLLPLIQTASFRLAALYVLLFTASAFVLAAAVLVTSRDALEEKMRSRIEAEVSYLQDEHRSKDFASFLELVRVRGRGASALDYLVQASDGRHLVGEMPAVAELQPGWTSITVEAASEDGGRPEKNLAKIVALDSGVLLAVGSDLGQLGDVEDAVITAFASTVSLAALLGISGGIWLSRAFLRRVDAIARTAEAIIAGDLARRVPRTGTGDDLDRLAATLNRMLDRIAVLMESLQQVSSDVAHDLRTPLTRLYQRLEDARAQTATVEQYGIAVEAAAQEADGLLQTFASLLRIAQVEGTLPTSNFRPVDLSALAETVVDAYRPDMEAQGHRVVAGIAPGFTIHGDRELLTQAFANVMENALRHTPEGTLIRLDLMSEPGGRLILSIADNGPGVSEADRPKLVRRFFRAEHSRITPGSGLGLSLAHAVAELHGGRLDFESAKPGLRILFVFPRPPSNLRFIPSA